MPTLPKLNTLHRVLRRAQGAICALCGLPMTQRETTVDHVIPRSRGGPDRLGNFIAAHRKCNARKGDRTPTACELLWAYAVNVRLGLAR